MCMQQHNCDGTGSSPALKDGHVKIIRGTGRAHFDDRNYLRFQFVNHAKNHGDWIPVDIFSAHIYLGKKLQHRTGIHFSYINVFRIYVNPYPMNMIFGFRHG